jgi:CheY-like chemotaxis protein
MKILLIAEDEPIIRFYLSTIISGFNYELHMAKDGSQGIEMYDKYGADVIITDIHMLPVDGIEFIKHVRERDKKVPIHALSAYDDDLSDLGINSIMKKPVDLNVLSNLLKQNE